MTNRSRSCCWLITLLVPILVVGTGCQTTHSQAQSALSLGMRHELNGELDSALLKFSEAIELDGTLADAYLKRANLLDDMARYVEAVDDYTQLLKLDLSDNLARFNRSVAYFHLRLYDEAIADVSSILETNPGDVAAWKARGRYRLRKKGLAKEALQDFEKALELQNDDLSARIGKADALRQLRRLKDAIQLYDQIVLEHPDHAEAWIQRGIARWHTREIPACIRDLSTGIKLDHKASDGYFFRGRAFLAINDLAGALTDLDRAVELQPHAAHIHFQRARALQAIGASWALNQAVAAYSEAIRLRPDYAQAYNNRAVIHLRRKQFAAAKKDCTAAIKYSPKLAAAYANRAKAWDGEGNSAAAAKDREASRAIRARK